MAQVITIAGERLFALKAQNNEQLDIDTFIFANVPGQDPNATINRNEGLPPAGQQVHTQIVQQVGRVNDNVVIYSTVLDSLTGPFEFNWVGLYSSVNQTLVAISHIPTVQKTVTVPGAAGNTLNRNFGIEYSGIADLTGITVAPETWQLDYTARLNGMDELTRQLAADMNGKDWFIGDGFKVVPRSTLNTFKVTPGAGYVSGLRVELSADHILTLSSYPQFVYVDAWFDGTSGSQWKGQTAFTVSNTEMDDYVDVNGKQHFVFKLANITSAYEVIDLRDHGEINRIKRVIDGFVTPEMFGSVGENDNGLFLAAASAGKPIKAFGENYNLNQLVFNVPVDLEFGETTVINNIQSSGAKQPAIRCIGPGRVGSVMTVTAIGSGLYRQVTVNDASQLSVGDHVEMRENMALRLEVGVSSPSMQDFNHYEFFTVESVEGNVVTFEEYVMGNFELSSGILLSKVVFLHNCNIKGGIYKGGSSAGGGAAMIYCRKSNLIVKAEGIGDSIADNQRLGGPAGLLRDCWESYMRVDYAQWTLFSGFVERIQSSPVEIRGGKRTSNGGLIVEGARSGFIFPAAQGNPGDTSGDGMGVSGRTQGVTFGPLTIAGAKCHTVWVRQPVRNNTFLPITSINSITSVLNLYGDDNFFSCVKAVGCPGVTFEGSGNTVHLEYEGPGTGAFFAGGTSRNKLTGRSRTKSDTDFDVLIGADITDTTIDMDCGERGLGYGSGVQENHSNNIDIRGPKPYRLGAARTTRGFVWSNLITGVTSTPQAVLIPGTAADTNGLKQLTAPTQDIPDVFKIILKTTNFLADTYSEYILTGGQSAWDVRAVIEGSSSYAPRIQDSSGTIIVRLNTEEGPNNVAIQIEKF